jgi:hypothetical protein
MGAPSKLCLGGGKPWKLRTKKLVAPSFERLSARRVGKHGGSRGFSGPSTARRFHRDSAREARSAKNAGSIECFHPALHRRIRPRLCAYTPTSGALDVRGRGFVVFHPDIRPRFLLYLAEKALECSQKIRRNQRLFACFLCALVSTLAPQSAADAARGYEARRDSSPSGVT